MNSSSPQLRLGLRAGALIALLLITSVPPLNAQTCPPKPTLASGVPVTASTDPVFYTITPGLARWSGVGVRAADAKDWNLNVLDTEALYPGCLHGALGNSSGAGIDFAVTDWRFRFPQDDYVRVGTGGSTGTSALVEYEQPAFEYQSNRPFDQIFIDASDLLTVRETDMQAGVRYTFEVWPSAGLSGLRFFLFEPVTAGTGWVPRSARVFEIGLFDDTGNLFEYTPSVSGQFGIVITNEDGTAGNYYFCVKHCPFFASTLTDNAPVVNVFLDEWPGFMPPAHTWGVVGERGEPGNLFTWDVAPGFRQQNGPYMTCTDSILASQPSGLGTKVIAGDFRSNPLRFYTAHESLEGQPRTTSEGYMEWEDGQDSLVVNDPPTAVTPPAHNVFDAWSVRLIAGGTYTFTLTPNGGATANYKLLLFANPSPGSEYWATREEAVLDAVSPTDYSPTATDLYSLVVVNDNGGTGGYTVGVTSTLVGVDPQSPAVGVSRIRSVQPNPNFAGVRIVYELARAGRASLRVTDVVGRTVADAAASAGDAGTGSLAWNGRTSGGVRSAAGVYFATLYLDGVAQDRAKLILLR